MQSFSFLLKHKAGVQNQVDGALSCRHYLLSTMRVNVVGFEIVKGLCKEDPFFAKVWEECSKGPHYPFFLQDGYLFKGNCLCIPHCSLRNFIIIEAHGSGLAGCWSLWKRQDACYCQGKFLLAKDGERCYATLGAL